MSTENAETQQPKAPSLEDSFNLLVNLARQSKLTYQEHAVVEKAVNAVLVALQKSTEAEPKSE